MGAPTSARNHKSKAEKGLTKAESEEGRRIEVNQGVSHLTLLTQKGQEPITLGAEYVGKAWEERDAGLSKGVSHLEVLRMKQDVNGICLEGVSHLEEVDESWQQKRKNYHQKCENGMDESGEKKGKRLNEENYHQKWENGTEESDEKKWKRLNDEN